MFYTSMYLGNNYLSIDVIVILVLSGVQLLTLMKIAHNAYLNATFGDEPL